MTDIDIAREVLQIEIQGLIDLGKSLDESFRKVIDILYHIKGRIILSGMGKSGHIANKIAATLSSTGSAAFYVHPGEASHGDLGMISRDDAVILLSNSGETQELDDIIHYCKRFSIPLIAIVRNINSTMASGADVALVLPNTKEAISFGVPTTSTTMMIALGDAIAISLLNRKKFTSDDYRILHPGGKLGAGLIRVTDIMHKGDKIPFVRDTESMSNVLITMTSHGFGCAAVINEKKQLIGIITDGDLRRHMSPDLTSRKAFEVMTHNPITIKVTSLAAEAVNIMNKRSITSLFAMDNDKLAGIIHIHDCLRAGVK